MTMRTVVTILTIGLLVVFSTLTFGAKPVNPTPTTLESWRTSEDVIKIIEQYLHPGDTFLWPRPDEKTFRTDEIPVAVRSEASSWVAKVLQEPYVQRDLSGRFVGVRRARYTPPMEYDDLFAHYEAHGMRLQICDTTMAMSVVAEGLTDRPDKPPADWAEAQEQLVRTFRLIFQKPSVPIKYVYTRTFSAKAKDGHLIHYGTIGLDPYEAPGPRGRSIQGPYLRYWHDSMTFFVDGYQTGFLFSKTDATPFLISGGNEPVSGRRW